jgi:hypothetical protein
MPAHLETTSGHTRDAGHRELPAYETPRIRVMTEQEILNSFQLTQSMPSWWVTAVC